jgi:hypothetical protein
MLAKRLWLFLFSLILGMRILLPVSTSAQGLLNEFRSESEKGEYTSWINAWRLDEPGKGTFKFTATAASDIHIAISELPSTRDPMYEIVIGGWGNTKSVVRRKSQGPAIYETGKKVFQPGVPTDFWLSVDKDKGMLSVGTGTEVGKNFFIQCHDPNFLKNVFYIALSSWEVPVAYAVGKAALPVVIESKPTGVYVRTQNAVYGKNEKVVVEYNGFPEGSGAWINVVPKASREDEWGNYQYTKGASGKLEFEFSWGLEPGVYEVRGYFSSSDNSIKSRYTFTVQ